MEKDNYARSDSTWMRFGSAPTECVAVRTTSFGSRLAFSAPLAVLAFNWLGPSPSDARGAGVYHTGAEAEKPVIAVRTSGPCRRRHNSAGRRCSRKGMWCSRPRGRQAHGDGCAPDTVPTTLGLFYSSAGSMRRSAWRPRPPLRRPARRLCARRRARAALPQLSQLAPRFWNFVGKS
jgi:hypothetical protein